MFYHSENKFHVYNWNPVCHVVSLDICLRLFQLLPPTGMKTMHQCNSIHLYTEHKAFMLH